MQITLELPDDLVSQLGSLEDKLPQILLLGLRELNASTQVGFTGAAEVLEFLAGLPSQTRFLHYVRLRHYKPKLVPCWKSNRTQGLTRDEEQIWQQYQYLEHRVRIAKAQALIKLKPNTSPRL
ncbi:hypothetical protein [Leptolyngbya ohadii]|uniref:hypothetical protein n=1 Tax=Leptolyngbya ohadii TaxID=1962290 RepID=UPI0021F12DFB|nr:hypothetical protein [Leptolyngbya ohadii]